GRAEDPQGRHGAGDLGRQQGQAGHRPARGAREEPRGDRGAEHAQAPHEAFAD
ncbi:MAG: LSU ribosomal protein L24p (L26e), partial [uncultured Gemmatimonadetes bacterium]